MKLGIIINCVGYYQNVIPLQVTFLENVLPELEKLGNIEVDITLPNSDWVYARIKEKVLQSQDQEKVKDLLKKPNKGFIVRLALQKYTESKQDVILHIDGSGKFDINFPLPSMCNIT